ncbi:hybrid sensor histidine kinase/response regulator [Novipirellula artificiosorum]|uniref:histidine kinase n=1 Tax=Novipirellula artificiosorum TaxID=2528016 RepID=A0A5C6DC03_9BACT|nr:Hpt domain-containing protein [Novipirellula artificiosorum]TWU34290.1 Gliding motility regulatory protein [Novipirellula artificiosorum]
MDKQKIAECLMATYIEELHEHISNITRELLRLEKRPDPGQQAEAMTNIFRVIHTLKGVSGMANVEPIRNACHLLEEIFGSCREQQSMPSEDAISTVFATMDAFEEIGSQLRLGEPIDEVRLNDLIPDLKRLASDAMNEHVLTDGPPNANKDDSNPLDVPPSSTAGNREESMLDLLLPVFIEELGEHVTTLSEKALAMEKAESPEASTDALTEMFRVTHSLKGAAGAVKLGEVQEVCHRLEDLLSEVRDGKTVADADLVSRILVVTDAISDAGDRLSRGESMESSPIQVVLSNWDQPLSNQAAADLPADDRSLKGSTGRPNKPVEPPVANLANHGGDEPRHRKQPEKQVPAGTNVAATPKRSVPSHSKSHPTEKVASIRVPAQKLDALLAHNGELLVARGRLNMRAKDASDLRDMMSDLKSFWRASQRKKPARSGDRSQRQAFDFQSTNKDRDAAVAHRLHGAGSASPRTEQFGIRLAEIATKVDQLASAMEADNRLLGQTCGLLDDEIYHVRMLPFLDACGGLERAVRDIAKSSNKQVTLRIEGADVEVDRSVLEGLKDPLMHLVRNAVDHGIEASEVRAAAGKPKEATITVAASLRGGQVEVRVQDDGAGLDLGRICSVARKRAIEVPEDPREQARLVFAPGFSTAKVITDISGRGVGLDVVHSQVESLHGDVDVSFEVGLGTRFTLMVPLTLTTIRCMMVRVADQTYAIPTTSVGRLVRFEGSDLKSSAGCDTLILRESPTRLVALETILGLQGRESESHLSDKRLAVVMAAGEQRVAIAVDDVMSESEVLVKNPGPRIRRLRYFSGCTLLPNGRIALVINAANLVRAALGLQTHHSQIVPTAPPKRIRRQLLLADDSMTTRLLLKNILETAGYIVMMAADGQEAWEIAQEHTFDAVVSDVDMPRASGFELTERLRAVEATAELPVVLVSARGSDQDKERGIAVGANAYIVKGSFDQKVLLETLEQLV